MLTTRLVPAAALLALSACVTTPPPCAPAATWVSPATLRPIPDPVAAATLPPVILLGEQHDSQADHRWQLDTIRAIAARDPSLVLGFEMFPRAAQPVLNAWVRGSLSEPDFLRQTDWAHVWGIDPALYLPIFRFARDHRIPMIALNVSRRPVHLAAQHGWAAVPLADREGVGNPAPPSAAYRASLAEAMAGHGMPSGALDHFIDAQQVWDRAMAEAIAAQRARDPGRRVVALMGIGHLQDREGVPWQLADLRIKDLLVLLPQSRVCSPLGKGYADAIWVEQ